MRHLLTLSIEPQPDDASCGATCLHAVYDFHGDRMPLSDLIAEVPQLEPDGGTLAPWLGTHALRRGYAVRLIVYDLRLFDPSWFRPGVDIAARLAMQRRTRRGKRMRRETDAFLEFLAAGGVVEHVELGPRLVEQLLAEGRPVIAALSATYLYGLPRERGSDNQFDDLHGQPAGHFVVLRGYDGRTREVFVADPMGPAREPLHPFGGHEYWIGVDRVLGAVMLGVLTRDGNLLVVEPGGRTQAR
jgi:hypothetical protein